MLGSFLGVSAAQAQDGGFGQAKLAELQLKYRWVFTMTNLARDDALQKTIDLDEAGKRAGYNGIFVADSKFAKSQLQPKQLRAKRPPAARSLHRAAACS